MRIIPAYAGSTRAGACGPSAPTDHPRIRGEHPHDPLRGRLSAGIIPAYAGSTSAGRRASRSRSDHPRIRGEHARPSTGRVDDVGSSPHTRGALCCHDRRPRRAVDHPRIRGEHQIHLNSTGDIRGSSPHTRGARPMARRRLRHRGIIPAYAGSTPVGRVAEMREAGSSPHTRGAQPLFLAKRRDHRIIPAYAGSTDPARQAAPGRQDHPRIRGEHPIAAKPDNLVMGSSPHTRGALPHLRLHVRHHRIIPAYAGSTRGFRRPRRGRPDHPRIRGEHMGTQSCELTCLGSSPHTRGAHGTATPPQRLSGIIPAYAGSTRRETAIYTIGLGSSPHTRGAPRRRRRHEDRRRIIPAYAGSTPVGRVAEMREAGSSPHTRGALPHLRLHVRHHRIIPAYAGSTSAGHGKASRWWDHPRIRGEHLHVLLNARMDAGSSPHTRGALSGRVRGRFPGRIIPAYAGSTSILRRRNSTHRDHPRIRGEHFQGRELRLRSEGSSPHTRGARPPRVVPRRKPRIIPAYAGSTIAGVLITAVPPDHPRIRGEHTRKTLTRADPAGSSPHTRGALC